MPLAKKFGAMWKPMGGARRSAAVRDVTREHQGENHARRNQERYESDLCDESSATGADLAARHPSPEEGRRARARFSRSLCAALGATSEQSASERSDAAEDRGSALTDTQNV